MKSYVCLFLQLICVLMPTYTMVSCEFPSNVGGVTNSTNERCYNLAGIDSNLPGTGVLTIQIKGSNFTGGGRLQCEITEFTSAAGASARWAGWNAGGCGVYRNDVIKAQWCKPDDGGAQVQPITIGGEPVANSQWYVDLNFPYVGTNTPSTMYERVFIVIDGSLNAWVYTQYFDARHPVIHNPRLGSFRSIQLFRTSGRAYIDIVTGEGFICQLWVHETEDPNVKKVYYMNGGWTFPTVYFMRRTR